jgi:hypothetical protein
MAIFIYDIKSNCYCLTLCIVGWQHVSKEDHNYFQNMVGPISSSREQQDEWINNEMRYLANAISPNESHIHMVCGKQCNN